MAAVNLKLSLTLFLGFYLACTSVECIPSLEVGPQNKTVMEGIRTSFICNVNDDFDGTIYWTFSVELGRRWYLSNDDYIYPHSNRDESNYRVTIDRQRQIYELILLSPSISNDTGIYECGYEFGPNRKYAVLAMATLTVEPLSESQTCRYNILPKLNTFQDQEVEVSCSWTYDQAGAAYFEKSNGETVDAGLRHLNRIVGRFTSGDVPGIKCSVGMVDDVEMVTKTACTSATRTDGQAQALVRVDPFINERTAGSNASFTCSCSDDDCQLTMSWNVVNGEMLERQGRIIKNQNVLTLLQVDALDDSVLIECQVTRVDYIRVSSFASLHVLEPTTTSNRRLPGESNRERTTDITMTSKTNDVELQTQIPPKPMPGYVVAIIIILIIIVALIVFIVVMVVKRKRNSSKGKHRTSVKQPMYDTIGPIPHTTPVGSNQVYALSFKDKKVKKNRNGDIVAVCDESHDVMIGGSLSASCGILNIQPSSTAEQVYAEPDVGLSLEKSQGHSETNFQGTRGKSASLPILDINEYETFSDADIDPGLKAHTLSALSVTSLTKSNRNDRWSSQRMTKLLTGTPPRARHALSLRRPTRKDPNVGSDYTEMTIEQKDVSAVDVVPTNEVPLNTNPDQANRLSSRHEYADVTKAFDRNPSKKENEVVDNYSGEINGPFAAPMASYTKNSKSASIHRMTSNRQPPPKPQRGKCQSQFLGNTSSYSVISDYETMSEQEARVNDGDYDDYAECGDDDGCPLPTSVYDQPRGAAGDGATVGEPPEVGDRATASVRASDTLPRISEFEGGFALTDSSGRKGQRAKSVSSDHYELVGDGRATGALQSPCYADIEEFTYATVSDKPEDGSEM